MNQEDKDIIIKLKNQISNICDEFADDNCNGCIVNAFIKKYKIDEDMRYCNSIYIIIHLLGINDNAAEFFVQQYELWSRIIIHMSCRSCENNRISLDYMVISCFDCFLIHQLFKEV